MSMTTIRDLISRVAPTWTFTHLTFPCCAAALQCPVLIKGLATNDQFIIFSLNVGVGWGWQIWTSDRWPENASTVRYQSSENKEEPWHLLLEKFYTIPETSKTSLIFDFIRVLFTNWTYRYVRRTMDVSLLHDVLQTYTLTARRTIDVPLLYDVLWTYPYSGRESVLCFPWLPDL